MSRQRKSLNSTNNPYLNFCGLINPNAQEQALLAIIDQKNNQIHILEADNQDLRCKYDEQQLINSIQQSQIEELTQKLAEAVSKQDDLQVVRHMLTQAFSHLPISQVFNAYGQVASLLGQDENWQLLSSEIYNLIIKRAMEQEQNISTLLENIGKMAEKPTVEVAGDLVMHKDTNIEHNLAPVIDNHDGGSIEMRALTKEGA